LIKILALISSPALAQDCDCNPSGTVLINEFMPNPDGTDDYNEWIELGATSESDLCGWTLQWGTSSFSKSYTFEDTTALANGDYLVFGGRDVPFADLNSDTKLAMGNAGSSGDALQLLRCDASVSDTVVYGPDNSDGWVDDTLAEATSLAPEPSSGESLSRSTDLVDTNASGDDFCSDEHPTPGEPNNEDCGAGGGDSGDSTPDSNPGDPCLGNEDIKLNELLPDPAGGDSGFEWAEIVNAGSAAVDLTGWELQYGTSSFSKVVAIEAGSLAPGAHWVIGDTQVAEADQVATLSLGNASNADAARIVDCNGVTADTVVYGNDNSDGWRDDSGEVADSIAPKPGSDESIARITDGQDSDASGEDFCVATEPTPGAANNCPVCDASGSGDVRINELVSNPDGTDGNREWVELVNLSSEPVSLDAWRLEVGKSSWSPSLSFPSGTTIEPGGFLVIAGQGYEGSADVVVDGFDLGNASSSDDGVRLVDCEDAVVDTVLYGPDDVSAELADDAGSAGTLAPVQGDDESIGRYPDGADSDDHAADWTLYSTPTPGGPNTAPAGDDTGGGGGDRPSGCCNDSPSAGRPEGSCSTTGAGVGWLVLVLCAGLLRRKE
jgi:hypothetical protein